MPDGRSFGGAPDLAVRSCFEVGYQSLLTGGHLDDKAGARLFRGLGLLRITDVSVWLAAALLYTDVPTARAALNRLAAVGLVQATGAHRYWIHDLLRLYASELAETDGPDDTAVHRVLAYLVTTARQASNLLRPPTNVPAADEFHQSRPTVELADSDQALDWLESAAHRPRRSGRGRTLRRGGKAPAGERAGPDQPRPRRPAGARALKFGRAGSRHRAVKCHLTPRLA